MRFFFFRKRFSERIFPSVFRHTRRSSSTRNRLIKRVHRDGTATNLIISENIVGTVLQRLVKFDRVALTRRHVSVKNIADLDGI